MSGLGSRDPGSGICVMPPSVALVTSLSFQLLDHLQNKGQSVEWFPMSVSENELWECVCVVGGRGLVKKGSVVK